MSRVLITGAAGVVGNALVQHLRSIGQSVIAINGKAGCDLESPTETQRLFEAEKPTTVYHLAGAVFGVGGNKKYPGDVFRRNILINTNVVEASRLAGVTKIVAMGSAAMYGDGLVEPFVEDDAMSGRPHDSEQAYAFAKRAMLVQLESYKFQFGLDFAFAIATNMYGPHDRFNPEYGHVIPSLVTKFADAEANGSEVEVWGDGTPTRDFLYCTDAAHGLELLMREGAGAYNLASGKIHRISDLVETIAARFPSVRYRWDPTKPKGQLSRSYSITRLQALGFRPSVNLEAGIAATVEWFKSHPDDVRVAV